MTWRIVPVNPTEDMLDANHCECGNAEERDGYIITDYQSMLNASPNPLEDDDLIERCARAVADARLREWGDYAGLEIRPVEYEYARSVLEVLRRG